MTFTVLDLGCGAGGASEGYRRAGFLVTGVDIVPQPNYPFEFIQADMLEFPLEGYDLYHVSPPCQRWSKQLRCREEIRMSYPDLITPMRPRLQATGQPYVIENVQGAPLEDPVELCSWSFGYETYRHRLFELSGFEMTIVPAHRRHITPASKAGHWEPGTFISVAGHCAPMWLARQVMDIHWKCTRDELTEAIPPYFTTFLGWQAASRLMVRRYA